MATTHHPLLTLPPPPPPAFPPFPNPYTPPHTLCTPFTYMPEDAHRHTRTHIYACVHATRARVASDGSSCVSVRVHMRKSVYTCVCVFARRVSERERACISSEESKKKGDGERVRGRDGENGKMRANSCACRRPGVCLYGETVSGGEGRERVKLMYLFCGHPHMLLGERRLAALARRFHGEADGRGDVAWLHVEYQPSVIAFVCKGRLFPSPSSSSSSSSSIAIVKITF